MSNLGILLAFVFLLKVAPKFGWKFQVTNSLHPIQICWHAEAESAGRKSVIPGISSVLQDMNVLVWNSEHPLYKYLVAWFTNIDLPLNRALVSFTFVLFTAGITSSCRTPWRNPWITNYINLFQPFWHWTLCGQSHALSPPAQTVPSGQLFSKGSPWEHW